MFILTDPLGIKDTPFSFLILILSGFLYQILTVATGALIKSTLVFSFPSAV